MKTVKFYDIDGDFGMDLLKELARAYSASPNTRSQVHFYCIVTDAYICAYVHMCMYMYTSYLVQHPILRDWKEM